MNEFLARKYNPVPKGSKNKHQIMLLVPTEKRQVDSNKEIIKKYLEDSKKLNKEPETTINLESAIIRSFSRTSLKIPLNKSQLLSISNLPDLSVNNGFARRGIVSEIVAAVMRASEQKISSEEIVTEISQAKPESIRFLFNKARYDKNEETIYKEYLRETTERPVVSNVYQCKSCKQMKIYIELIQIRSGDEGKTAFFECANCHNKWTVN